VRQRRSSSAGQKGKGGGLMEKTACAFQTGQMSESVEADREQKRLGAQAAFSL
jgi:hypothetical protein